MNAEQAKQAIDAGDVHSITLFRDFAGRITVHLYLYGDLPSGETLDGAPFTTFEDALAATRAIGWLRMVQFDEAGAGHRGRVEADGG